jgi:hypothetical protein
MKVPKTIKRELEVAFSKRSQPIWLRILKYVFFVVLLYFFWRSKLFWIIFIGVLFLGLILHFWVRYKTDAWTRSYGLWKHENDKTIIDNKQGS